MDIVCKDLKSDDSKLKRFLIRRDKPTTIIKPTDKPLWKEQYVYFIKSHDRVKIGKTKDLKRRLKQFLMHDSYALVLNCIYGYEEKTIHEIFSEFRIGKTEWFYYSPEFKKTFENFLETNKNYLVKKF